MLWTADHCTIYLNDDMTRCVSEVAAVGRKDSTDRESVAALLATIAEREQRLQKVEHERDEYRKLYLLAREQIAELKRGLLGRRITPPPGSDAQLTLALLGLMLEEPKPDQPQPKIEVPTHTRQKPVRKPLPEHLPRVTVEILPPEVEREGLDAFEMIGVERREVLERRPASIVVVEILKKKFVRKDRQSASTEVLVAETPELPIHRGMAGPGLLADSIVRRWQDHMPLHRLERVYLREQIELARSTLCTWHEALADLARPVVAAMRADALCQPYLCTDATGVLVMAPKRCKNGHFWVLVAPRRHVLFEFSAKHDSAAVDKLLGGYRGYLVADAHTVYDHLYKSGEVVEVGCWSHCRRYFLDALASDPERAGKAYEHIRNLFLIERTIADAEPARRTEIRREKSKPIVEKFFAWCTAEKDLVLDGSPIADAIRYATNQQKALERFLDDQRLPIHNNISELHLRRQATGRKNWMFVGSEDGARTNTVFVSLLASCMMHGIEPWGYLRDLFCLLPGWPMRRALELAPAFWPETFASAEVQQKLSANIFRRAVLDSLPHRGPP
jgi:transposase